MGMSRRARRSAEVVMHCTRECQHTPPAVTIFDGASWERVDDRKNYGEERWVSVGMLHGVEITVLYTDQPWRTTSFAGSFPPAGQRAMSVKRFTAGNRQTASPPRHVPVVDPRSQHAESLIPCRASGDQAIRPTERRAKVRYVSGRAASGVRRINVDQALESRRPKRDECFAAFRGWTGQIARKEARRDDP